MRWVWLAGRGIGCDRRRAGMMEDSTPPQINTAITHLPTGLTDRLSDPNDRPPPPARPRCSSTVAATHRPVTTHALANTLSDTGTRHFPLDIFPRTFPPSDVPFPKWGGKCPGRICPTFLMTTRTRLCDAHALVAYRSD